VVSGALPDLLARIVAKRRERYGLATDKAPTAPPFIGGLSSLSLTRSPSSLPSLGGPQVAANRFLAALRARAVAGGRGVIAEVKMGSPRLGSLAGRFDPERQAAAYAAAGATCLSVVVEPDFFFGSWELLARCTSASGLPAIAKDFVVCERQLDEAAAAGAEAILLVAALYARDELAAFAEAARRRGLVPLIETHDASDLARLGEAAWELVGVNNRDLRTFEVTLERSIAMAPRLPAGALRVAESGIATQADVDRLAAAGFDAFLIGESLLLADDPAAKLRELLA
jgi:indole-3-glycerol phosphate synthase